MSGSTSCRRSTWWEVNTMANLKDLSLQNNMPGMDFRGKRPDMGRNQAGMQQIEVGTSSVSCILSGVTNYCLILAQNFRVNL